MRKQAIILYGPPGSGKTTQARLLSIKLDLFFFDTGRFLEGVVHDPDRQKDRVIKKERLNFESGRLVSPSFVLKEVVKETKMVAKTGWGLIFSGSPRTIYETKGLLPLLEKIYGKKNIFVFILDVPESVSLKRNSARLVCKDCETPLLTEYYPSSRPKHCPVCGGSFYRRTLDDKKIIQVRLKEYEERTKPIFNLMKKRNYHIHHIDGRPAPYKIFHSIYGHFEKKKRA